MDLVPEDFVLAECFNIDGSCIPEDKDKCVISAQTSRSNTKWFVALSRDFSLLKFSSMVKE